MRLDEQKPRPADDRYSTPNEFVRPTLLRTLVHFKNAVHDGFFKDSASHREGPGITLMDNSACIIGNYKNDHLSGQTLIFLNPTTYAIAQFNKGLLDGPFVIRSPTLSVYSEIKSNSIDGEIVIIDYGEMVGQLWAIESNGMGQLNNEIDLTDIVLRHEQRVHNRPTEVKLDRLKNISHEAQILKQLAPYIEKAPNVAEFIKSFKFYGGRKDLQFTPGFIHRAFKTNQMICLADQRGGVDNLLALVLNKSEEMLAVGCFTLKMRQQGDRGTNSNSYESLYQMNGVGVQMGNREGGRVILAGEFMQNRLHGEGYKEIVGEKTLFGKFNRGDIREIDVMSSGESNEESKRLHLKRIKSIHIHSLKFMNNYANERPIFILNNLLAKIATERHP